MNRSTILKLIVLLISLTMFSLQMKVSIENLTNPPIVITEERLSFADIDPPLITICPENQIDEEKLKNFGYTSYHNFLLGKGTNINHSFWEILDQALIFSPEEDVDLILYSNGKSYYMSHFNRKFYGSLGYCWEISDYNLARNLEIRNIQMQKLYFRIECSITLFKVYVTDKTMVSIPTIDLSTHVGHDIKLEKGMDRSYFIEVSRFSSYNPRNKDYCKSYIEGEFESCVDNHVTSTFSQQSLHNYLLCNPPFLTSKNGCSNMKWTEPKTLNFIEAFKHFVIFQNVTGKLLNTESFVDKDICQPQCTVTRSNVKKGRDRSFRDSYKTTLNFDKTIIYSKAEFGYNFSNFLVDLGSAVGLWFGISVFGMTDIGMQLFSVGKETWRKVKSLSKI